MHPTSKPTSASASGWKARAAIGCTVAAAFLAAATTPASAGGPGLPSVPQVPKPPAVPQLPSVQPPPVTLPTPPSVPQVNVPRTPQAPSVSPPSLPGTPGGGSAGRAAPAAPGALPGQGTSGSLPYSTGGSTGSGSASARADRPAQRRRENRRLQRSVRNLQGCLSSVDGLDRRVLVLRTGLGGRPSSSRQSVARRLGVSQRRVARAERSGLKSLRGAARGGSCESGPSPMAVSRMPWLMPLSSASTGLPLLSMASLAGDSRAEERSEGAVKGVTRSGPEDVTAEGAESPGSLVSGDEAEREPKRVAASTGDSADLLLPVLLTLALLALLAGFVTLRNRRSTVVAGGPSVPERPPAVPATELRAATLPETVAAAGTVAPAEYEEEEGGAAEDEPGPEPEPRPAPEPRVEAQAPEPAIAPPPAPASPPPSAPPPAPASARPATASTTSRNARIAASAAALAAGGLIRALLRVRRRR